VTTPPTTQPATGEAVTSLARHLLDAETRRRAVAPITDEHVDLTPDDAYAVQAALVAARLARGERLVGAKLGLTSEAKQRAMGVDEPIFGWLTDAMALVPRTRLTVTDLIHPRAEPEIAFVLGDDLAGGMSPGDVLDATAEVRLGIEVIDSRYADFRFTLVDVIADNTSASRFVLADQGMAPRQLDLRELGIAFGLVGEAVAHARGSDVLGDPAAAVALLGDHAHRMGVVVPAGSVVLSGGLTNAVALAPGARLEARADGLGALALEVGA
jgi:2-oxo-3-hexenedioate decarboxylase